MKVCMPYRQVSAKQQQGTSYLLHPSKQKFYSECPPLNIWVFLNINRLMILRLAADYLMQWQQHLAV